MSSRSLPADMMRALPEMVGVVVGGWGGGGRLHLRGCSALLADSEPLGKWGKNPVTEGLCAAAAP